MWRIEMELQMSSWFDELRMPMPRHNFSMSDSNVSFSNRRLCCLYAASNRGQRDYTAFLMALVHSDVRLLQRR